MPVHFIHDLGRDSAVKPFAPTEAVCGVALREAHGVVAPESDEDVCPACLSWSKRNRYQDRRAAVEMSAAAAPRPAAAGAPAASISAETDA